MKELSILKLFTEKRETQEQYGVFLRRMENLDNSILLLARLIQEYYEKYPDHNFIGEDELISFYDVIYPNNRESAMHRELIYRMYKLDVSTDIMTDLLEQSMERYHSQIIVSKLIPVLEGQRFNVLPHVQGDLDNFISMMKNPPKLDVLQAIDSQPGELISNKATLQGANWHLKEITSKLGPMTPATLGVIFAYVDGGKTSFSLAALAKWAQYYKDSKETLVYACNEESGIRVCERLTSAFTGKSYAELYREYDGRMDELNDQLAEMGWHRVKVIDGVNHIKQIRRILDDWGPVALFIDQGSKVSTDYKAEGITETRLLYNEYRDLMNEYNCAGVAVEQAVGDAENKPWLTLADIYGSRVAVQGELDWAIGIGKTLDQRGNPNNNRYINLCKNKLKDGETGHLGVAYFWKEKCLWTIN